ncbi:fimbrial protein [Raoultella planticola]|uniref:fimbrial protein n=1 Tax=Raoultella planticola TaxID=575 RepID=UPI0013D72940|nr:fimbrial protein [Raoultella planticola]
MKIKALHAAFIALGMGISSSAFAAADVTSSNASVATLDFSGSVTSNSCQLATDSVQQTVNLGEVKTSTLQNNGQGPRHSFTINLVDCDSSTKGFEVTFEDLQGYDANRDYITNVSMGDGLEAKGVGVKIAKVDEGSDIELSTPVTMAASVDASGDAWPQQSFSFDAYMAGVGNTVSAGYVNASATVSITTN